MLLTVKKVIILDYDLGYYYITEFYYYITEQRWILFLLVFL